MKTRILKFEPDTGTVLVSFSHGDMVHRRRVNACFKGDGKYDAKATKERVGEVALGVERKIDLGAIGNEPPPSPPPAPTEPDPDLEDEPAPEDE